MINILKTILLAAVVAALAILLEQILAIGANIFWQKEIIFEFYSRFTWFLISAAAIEEILKYTAIYFVIRGTWNTRGKEFIFLSTLLGSGWGIFEVLLILFLRQGYYTDFFNRNPETIFFLSAIVAVHALTTYLMATLVASAAFSGSLKHLKILFFPFLAHLLFNFLIIQKGEYANILVIMSFAVVFLAGLSVLFLNFRRLD